jgi:Flp pilus assembly protein TadD
MTAHLDRARQLMELHRYDLAEKELREELAREPENGEAHSCLGICLTKRNQLDEAEGACREGIRCWPESAYAHAALAFVLQLQGRWSDAEKPGLEAVRLVPHDAGYLNELAFIRLRLGRPAEAEATAKAGLKIDPRDVGCLNTYAHAVARQGRIHDGMDALLKALEIDPDNAYTLSNFAWLEASADPLGWDRSAFAPFVDALRIDPHLDGAREGILLILSKRSRLLLIVSSCLLFLLAALSSGLMTEERYLSPSRLLEGKRIAITVMILAVVMGGCTIFNVAFCRFPLLFSRFSRHLMSRDQRRAAVLIVVFIPLAIALCALEFYLAPAATAIRPLWASFLAVLGVPVSMVFQLRSMACRVAMFVYALLACLAGVVGMIRVIVEPEDGSFLSIALIAGGMSPAFKRFLVEQSKADADDRD